MTVTAEERAQAAAEAVGQKIKVVEAYIEGGPSFIKRAYLDEKAAAAIIREALTAHASAQTAALREAIVAYLQGHADARGICECGWCQRFATALAAAPGDAT